MSVLVKGMEMPTSCGECELCACYVWEDGTEENYRCPITMYPIHNFDERHNHCPLIPVPPHGDLIDRDALPWIEGRDEHDNPVYLLIKNCTDVVPTVIPASEEGNT